MRRPRNHRFASSSRRIPTRAILFSSVGALWVCTYHDAVSSHSWLSSVYRPRNGAGMRAEDMAKGGSSSGSTGCTTGTNGGGTSGAPGASGGNTPGGGRFAPGCTSMTKFG